MYLAEAIITRNANAMAAITKSEPTTTATMESFIITELEVCFDKLNNTVKAKYNTLDKLAKTLAAITTTDTDFVTTNSNC